MPREPELIHQALVGGDIDALRRAFVEPAGFPHCRDQQGTSCLEHAITAGPFSLIRALLAAGADPNEESIGGFPPLLAAIDRGTPDRLEVLTTLLAAGADIQQRGINDYTPLHQAAARDDVEVIALLLAHGADPEARTRIDDRLTPLEEAELLGCQRAIVALRAAGR